MLNDLSALSEPVESDKYQLQRSIGRYLDKVNLPALKAMMTCEYSLNYEGLLLCEARRRVPCRGLRRSFIDEVKRFGWKGLLSFIDE
jgi:hypothetical protein